MSDRVNILINLYGGPGAGKSTGATYVFSRLKLLGISCEYVPEYHKCFVYNTGSNQLDWKLFNNLQFEGLQAACRGNDIIITDAPIALRKLYAPGAVIPVVEVGRVLNILINRVKKYREGGRWQTEEQAVVLDQSMHNCVERFDLTVDGNQAGYDQLVIIILNLIKDITHV